jgi:hypothetical protein
VAAITQLYPVLRTVDGTLLGPLTGECDTSAGELATVTIDAAVVGVPSRVIEGRLPAAGAADEIAIATTTAGRAGVHVGDTVYLHGTCHNDEPPIDPPLPLRVVGEIVGFLDVRTAGQDLYFENVVVTRALLDDLDRVTEDIIGVWLRDGSSAADLVSQTADGAPVGGRFAWRRYAESLGVVPEPVTPWLLIIATATGVLTTGVVVSFVPGWRAARVRPGALLRGE